MQKRLSHTLKGQRARYVFNGAMSLAYSARGRK